MQHSQHIASSDDLHYGSRGEGLVMQLTDGHIPHLFRDNHGRAAILATRANPADHIAFPHSYSLPRTVRTLGMVRTFISIFREKWDPGYVTTFTPTMLISGFGIPNGHPVTLCMEYRGTYNYSSHNGGTLFSPDYRACKHSGATGNHGNGLIKDHLDNHHAHCPLTAATDPEHRAHVIKNRDMCLTCPNPRYALQTGAERSAQNQHNTTALWPSAGVNTSTIACAGYAPLTCGATHHTLASPTLG
jgi:hypothetical protein